ncbi:MAG: ABC transporter permease subunit [Anaerolineae bacterium]
MAKFIIRRLLLMLLTMFLVSVAVFVIAEAAPGNVARNVLGIQITPEQEASFLAQTGLDRPIYERYAFWLIGSDWLAARRTGLRIRQITTEDGYKEWWALDEDGNYIRWELLGEDLIAHVRQPNGSEVEFEDNERWEVKDPEVEIERLEAHRAEVVANQQLSEAAREEVLEHLDQILGILRNADDIDQPLAEALEGPENALTALVDGEASQAAPALETAAREVADEGALQAITVYDRLTTETTVALGPDVFQSMARQLNGAADALQNANPSIADTLRRAAEDLEAEEQGAAVEKLSGVVPAIRDLTGSLDTFAQALLDEDYQQGVAVLRDLTDPAVTSFDAARLAAMPGLFDQLASSLADDAPQLSTYVGEAATHLEAGNTQEARAALTQAADRLAELGEAIVRSDSASQSRVVRTFWGVDTQNHAVNWEKGTGKEVWVFIMGTGWKSFTGGPVEYIPLQKGLLRGDPGISLRTGRPVANLLFTRLRNSLVLAGIAFAIVMPLALVLGLIAGLNEGKLLDRVLSIGGMMFSVTPEFATGIFLILIFAFWLEWVPGATVFGEDAPWTRPDMLILPVLTLTLIELGYVLRVTRASMVEVMKAPYIRTAFLKGLPYRQVIFKHAVRNALMAPITVIMLHVNWLLGGIVIVEVIFGYPGLGSYLLESALFKDFNAIEGGAMILVAVAVGTQLLADVTYTFLNPRIRYG